MDYIIVLAISFFVYIFYHQRLSNIRKNLNNILAKQEEDYNYALAKFEDEKKSKSESLIELKKLSAKLDEESKELLKEKHRMIEEILLKITKN